jgi:hypothetical protein
MAAAMLVEPQSMMARAAAPEILGRLKASHMIALCTSLTLTGQQWFECRRRSPTLLASLVSTATVTGSGGKLRIELTDNGRALCENAPRASENVVRLEAQRCGSRRSSVRRTRSFGA